MFGWILRLDLGEYVDDSNRFVSIMSTRGIATDPFLNLASSGEQNIPCILIEHALADVFKLPQLFPNARHLFIDRRVRIG